MKVTTEEDGSLNKRLVLLVIITIMKCALSEKKNEWS